MRRSLLAQFRDRDGRSLMRALAVLLTLNAIVAGLHSGAMAAPAGSTILCAATAGNPDNPPQPVRADFHDHCLASCTAPAVPDAGMAELASPAFVISGGLTLRPIDARQPAVSHHAQPRGPPSLA